jgi:NADPH:quinone reductase-like Zn-dependent oxidoreductase
LELERPRKQQSLTVDKGKEMKAITYRQYGGPEVLRLGECERPAAAEGEVLIRVHASSINAVDYRLMRANPFLVRLANGLLSPKKRKLGSDVSGVVEQVGPGVKRVKVGDEVFGQTLHDGGGGFAEYVCVRESAVAVKPEELDFVQSAALVLAGLTALQAVRDRAKVRPGQSVLIQGAGGGVGTLLVQVAKAYGSHVTAVCGPGSVELVTSLGADRVIDYTKKDFTQEGGRYDAIFGVNGHRPLAAYRNALKPGGAYVVVGGDSRTLFQAMFLGALRFAGSGRKIELLRLDADRHTYDLEELRELIAAQKLRPVIDHLYPLDETAAAMRYVEGGHVRGKVVLQVVGA